ncbi:MAG: glycosyltransferase family 2 protein [bacterium]
MSLTEQAVELVSVLVITHNRKEELEQCLKSVRRQNYPAVEIIVVDNNSTDGTATMIREQFSEVEYVGLEENRGIEARNFGADQAQGDVIVTLDDDSELPSRDVLDRIVEIFRRNSDLGAAGFRIIDAEGEEEPWFVWPYEGDGRNGYKSPTFLTCGAAIRPEMFERTGGFWGPYFIYVEERDFATRIIASGSEIRYFPSITVIHHRSGTGRGQGRFLYYVTRNTIWYIWRNFPLFHAIGKTIGQLFKQGWRSFRKGGLGLYFKGIFDAILGFGKVWRTREPVDPQHLNWVDGKFEEGSSHKPG